MESYSIVIILLAVVIALMAIAPKFKIPTPLLLMFAGIAVGFIPAFKNISISSEIVFLVFFPPMLYSDAINISFPDFRKNIRTISLLAISLVFITIAGIATVAHFLIPGLSWPMAFTLGAILSPTDSIAASASLKELNIPNKTKTIIESESLVNDASALIAFRFSVAAVSGATFVFWNASLQFIVAFFGGILVGSILWFVFSILFKKARNNSLVVISLTLLLPFVAYLIAQELTLSGVMAVVTIGLHIARYKNHIFTKATRQQSESVWNVIVFILNGIVFILIGMEFPHTLKNMHGSQIWMLTGCAFLIFLVALIIRMLIIFWHKIGLDRDIGKIKKIPQHLLRTKRGQKLKNIEPLGWKESIVIGWSGMRGIISLATALALPLTFANGALLPHRDTIIFLTVMVVLIMLIIQGLGLPLLLKLLKIDEKQK